MLLTRIVSVTIILLIGCLNVELCPGGLVESPDVELVHIKFCRKVLCVRRSMNVDALYGELGKVPVRVRRKLLMIK